MRRPCLALLTSLVGAAGTVDLSIVASVQTHGTNETIERVAWDGTTVLMATVQPDGASEQWSLRFWSATESASVQTLTSVVWTMTSNVVNHFVSTCSLGLWGLASNATLVYRRSVQAPTPPAGEGESTTHPTVVEMTLVYPEDNDDIGGHITAPSGLTALAQTSTNNLFVGTPEGLYAGTTNIAPSTNDAPSTISVEELSVNVGGVHWSGVSVQCLASDGVHVMGVFVASFESHVFIASSDDATTPGVMPELTPYFHTVLTTASILTRFSCSLSVQMDGNHTVVTAAVSNNGVHVISNASSSWSHVREGSSTETAVHVVTPTRMAMAAASEGRVTANVSVLSAAMTLTPESNYEAGALVGTRLVDIDMDSSGTLALATTYGVDVLAATSTTTTGTASTSMVTATTTAGTASTSMVTATTTAETSTATSFLPSDSATTAATTTAAALSSVPLESTLPLTTVESTPVGSSSTTTASDDLILSKSVSQGIIVGFITMSGLLAASRASRST